MVQLGMRIALSHTFTHSHTDVPEYAKAGMCVVGETAKAKPLASLEVSQNKSKVLHSHSLPRSVQMNVGGGG